MSPLPLFFLRIAQSAILLAGLGCLAYGGWRLYDEFRFLASSVQVRAEVVALHDVRGLQRGGGFGPTDSRSRGVESTSATATYPIVRFRSPVDRRLHRAESSVDTDRLRVGSTVSVRASTRDAGDARLPDLVGRFLVPGLLVLVGLLGTVLPVLLWHAPDSVPGDAAGTSLFRSFSLWKAALAVAAIGVVAAIALLVTADSWRLARGVRAEGLPPGRLLGTAERAIARVPRIGPSVATAAVIGAIDEGRHDDLRRYVAAYRDPAIRFPLKLGRVGYFRIAAARAGDAEAVRILAEGGLDPRREQPRLLPETAARGRTAILRQLAAMGVAPSGTAEAQDLVESALVTDQDETLAAIAELGWVDLGQTFAARRWGTPEDASVLDFALVRGLPASARALELRGAETHAPALARVVAGDVEELRAILPERAWKDARPLGVPLLSVAARAGQLAMVRRLVQAGADPGAVARLDGITPEASALDDAVRRGHLEVVRYLATLPGAKAWLDPADRAAPVAIASDLGRADLVRVLVEAGATPNATYTDRAADQLKRATPLHRAAFDGNAELTEYLLAHGADPRAEAADRVLPIELARDDRVYAVLAKAGGDP